MKRRENSAIPRGRSNISRKRSKVKGKSKSRHKSKNQRKSHKSYNQIKKFEMTPKNEKKDESEAVVDDFCKELYDFLEESKVESKSILFPIFQFI